MTEYASNIVGSLMEKLTNLALEEIQLASSVQDDREKLRSTLVMIQKVLRDAEQKQIKYEAVKQWLLKLKDFCYDAEDVLTEFEAKSLSRRARPTSADHSTFKMKVRYLFSWLSKIVFQFKMAHKLKGLRERLDMIDGEKARFNLSTDAPDKSIVQRRETHSFVSVQTVIGRHDDKRRIIELLMRSDDGDSGKICAVPIIGIGGSGKTTLAKWIYMDDVVNKHFELKVWLSMQLEFELTRVIRDIVKSLRSEANWDSWNLEELQHQLRSILKNKRCLFVMDDVWEVKHEEWMELLGLLEGVSSGSKVLVTSRNNSVVSTMGAVSAHYLKNLSNEDSLTLFTKCAFDRGQEKCNPDLMKTGEEIVRKCGGNPMALKALGSLLYSKTKQTDWESVRDNDIWRMETDILPSLKISYDLMPTYLKQCFAYCSIFPKSHEFNNLELIHLWISNGLIQSGGKNQELEDIGQQYWEELWSRSFFDDVTEENLVVTFKMHDLIHELAISVAQNEAVTVSTRNQSICSTIRHISFSDHSLLSGDEPLDCLETLSGIRTIMFPMKKEGPASEYFLEMCISRFKYLRALYLHDSSFDKLPSSIGRLKHLKFLHLCGNHKIKKLPSSICELLDLQSLGLAECHELEGLPGNIKSMINLRFLDITTKQERLPENSIGSLTSLRCLFIGDCKNLQALFEDMHGLTSLKKLFILGCPKLAFVPQGIKSLELEDLCICNCENLKLPEGKSDDPRVRSRLRSLALVGLPMMRTLPQWLERSAHTLQKIDISNCPNLMVLPAWLPNCSSLRKLKVEDCPKLSSLPDSFHRLAAMREFRIDNCGQMSETIEDKGSEYWRKISHIPEVYVNGKRMK